MMTPAHWWHIALWAVVSLAAWRGAHAGQPGAGSAAGASDPAASGRPNRLINEKSPYLLQHAHNPVDWFPWGREAFEKAKREDKPVFLSVGYSTCYWCHVMEKESFEDPDVAKLMNEHFVAIKVDREERPDIDEQYMLATQLVTGRGGWPNSVWLTPDGKPWMAGTYFPKPRFISALAQLADIWAKRRSDVNKQADALATAIAEAGKTTTGAGGGGELKPEIIDRAVAALMDSYDARNGGFGAAPKFPPHGTLQLLIRQYRDTADKALLDPITKTLDAMWLGGMHDHIGGGFHRYSTDARWLLPHFEKMLYDNAQLMRNDTDGFLVTRHERYREAVEDIFRWVRREMTSPQGAFYSAIDSGEVGKEGESYVWRIEQVEDALGRDDAALFADIYHFKKGGNFSEESTGRRPGTNIPHLDEPIEAIAQKRGEDPTAFAARIAQMRARLLAERQTRPQPHKDDKILTSWNGLMIGSLAYAGRQLGESRYTEAAARAADFILGAMMRDGALLRTYRDGEAKLPGYLDDYAYFAEGLIELHRTTGEARWLDQADRLASALLSDFQDRQDGGFFFTARGHEDLIMRSKNLAGGGNIPSANGVAAQVLLDLAERTGKTEYRAAARHALESLAGLMEQSPFSTEHLLLAAADHLRKPAASKPAPGTEIAGDTGAAPLSPDVSTRAKPVTIQAYASHLSIRPGWTLQVAVAIDIDDGWHLYGQNPEVDFLVPSTVSIEPAENLVVGEVVAPAAHRAMDSVLKQTVNTYAGRIWFRASVKVGADAKAGAIVLTLNVKTQACDSSRCLPPQTTTLRIPLLVDPGAPSETRHPKVFAAQKP